MVMSKQLKSLIATSLRYANPQATDRLRKKGRKNLSQAIINQYLLSGLVFLAVYGSMLFMTDFAKMPGTFTYFAMLFFLLGLSQGVSIIYNIFFESKDLGSYLPLPFKQSQIFIAKNIVVALSVVPFIIPLLILFFLTSLKSKLNIVLAGVISSLLFIVVLLILFAICSLIVFGITKTKVFQKHKKLMTTLLLWVTMALVIIGIMLMNQDTADSYVADRNIILPMLPLFHITHAPFSGEGLISIVGVVGFLLILAFLVKWQILPQLYEQVTNISSTEQVVRRKHKKNQNLQQILRRYNFELVKNPSLITQVLSSSLVFPVVFIATFALNGSLSLRDLPLKYVGVAFFGGIVLALITINQTSFVGNLISLDGENYTYMQTLPVSRKEYLVAKFKTGLLIQGGITLILSLATGLVLQGSLFFIVSFVLGSLLGTLLLSQFYFVRDYRLLLVDWTNFTQLFLRGSGRVGLIFMMWGSMILGAVLIGGYVALLNLIDATLVNAVVALGIIAVGLWLMYYYRRNFWQKVDQVSWQRKIDLARQKKIK
ncbi:ABC transporter [Enterococcus montenegrensis]|uniref:ABC transporter n=1 Tax=Enterococcus montenegrensis TaxID=3031993 RepID=UPI00249E3DE4|nr:ABC transporter [Enterococcus montenegrensis]WHA08834.1 ABC transporter [Enterococcus montenegrensis]